MLRKVGLLIVAVSLLMVFGCKISGTVQKDGIGFKGITIKLNDNEMLTTTTDSNGYYEFDFVFPGLYSVTVENCDTTPESQMIIKISDPFEAVTGVDFSIEERIWGGDYYTYEHNGTLDDLSGYTSVNGYLGIVQTELTDLKGLECMEEVSAGLFIGANNSLTSLSGLNNLKSAYSIIFNENPMLTSLDALQRLTTVGEVMYIADTNLATLEGLNNLTTVDGAVFIVSNNSLINIDGLESLSSIGSMAAGGGADQTDCLFIVGNPLLENVNGLNSLESVENELLILANGSLTDVSGLNNLKHVGMLGIGVDENICDDTCTSGPLDNPLLTSLSGLSNLETITHNFWINANSGLTELSLTNLSTVGGDFSITNNTELCEGLATDLETQVIISGTTTISGNKTCP